METDYQRILDCIDPSLTDRQQWVEVGMALKAEDQPFEMFDKWSSRDSRDKQYKGTDATYKVWESFQSSGITGATLVEMARNQGNEPFPKNPPIKYLDWDDLIYSDGEEPNTKPKSVRPCPFKSNKKAAFQIIDYLRACFRPDDRINVICNSYENDDGKFEPFGLGQYKPTVKEYIDDLRTYADDADVINRTFGSYNHAAGVWIRINPIKEELHPEQKAIADKNVSRFDNALIECDKMSLEEQMRLIKALKLPYKALVYSGGKSVHAIVRVDAKSKADYTERVTWLQSYCIANGLPVDTQNKNASRMSRLPGCERGNQKQILLETSSPASFDDFRLGAEAAESAQKLVIKTFGDVAMDMPPLKPELIHGLLRLGHKMIVSGPSKAGKSFAMIGLAVALAEGVNWMGMKCEKSKVLYLNLEIDEPSFWKRVSDVYKSYGIEPEHKDNLMVINMRGACKPFDQLEPELEVILERHPAHMVIIDPIYKVITGDENSASDMGYFCNLFDKLSLAGGCSIAFCHHHSKGSQAHKSALDRASGSGVFGRDPDASVDMTQLEISDVDRQELQQQLLEMVHDQMLHETGQWQNLEKRNSKDLQDRMAKQQLVQQHLEYFPDAREEYERRISEAEQLGNSDAYRLEFTVREFKTPSDKNVFFRYPRHVPDPTGYLDKLFLTGDTSVESLNKRKQDITRKRTDEKRKWYDQQRADGKMVSVDEMLEHFKQIPNAKCTTRNTIRNWVSSQKDLKRDNGWIVFLDEEPPEKLPSRKGGQG